MASAQSIPNWLTCYDYFVYPGTYIIIKQTIKNPSGLEKGSPSPRFTEGWHEVEAGHAIWIDEFTRSGTYTCDIHRTALQNGWPVYGQPQTLTYNLDNPRCNCAGPLLINTGHPNNTPITDVTRTWHFEGEFSAAATEAFGRGAQYWNNVAEQVGANFRFAAGGPDVKIKTDASLPTDRAAAACAQGAGQIRIHPDQTRDLQLGTGAYNAVTRTAMHEFGHCVGIDHSPCGTNESVMSEDTSGGIGPPKDADKCSVRSDWVPYTTGTGIEGFSRSMSPWQTPSSFGLSDREE